MNPTPNRGSLRGDQSITNKQFTVRQQEKNNYSIKPRILIVETIYYQMPDEQPTSIDHRYCKWLENDEQPYSRKLIVKEEWQHLDKGWIVEPGLLVLENVETKFVRQPTDQEKADAATKIVEIGIKLNFEDLIDNKVLFACIYPGESIRLQPCNYDLYYIRCRKGTVRCNLNLYTA